MKLKIKRVLDISQPLDHNCPGIPGLPLMKVELKHTYPVDRFNLETIEMYTHTGTHIDAPCHMLDAAKTIDQIPVERFQGEAVPIDLYHKKPKEPITAQDLMKYDREVVEGNIVLLCTGWGEKRGFSVEYVYQSPYLCKEAAEWLVSKKVKGVGIDHFSVSGAFQDPQEEEEKDRPTHEALLGAEIWIMESLYLPREILNIRRWYLVAMPLLLKGGSGAPARAVVMEVGK